MLATSQYPCRQGWTPFHIGVSPGPDRPFGGRTVKVGVTEGEKPPSLPRASSPCRQAWQPCRLWGGKAHIRRRPVKVGVTEGEKLPLPPTSQYPSPSGFGCTDDGLGEAVAARSPGDGHTRAIDAAVEPTSWYPSRVAAGSYRWTAAFTAAPTSRRPPSRGALPGASGAAVCRKERGDLRAQEPRVGRHHERGRGRHMRSGHGGAAFLCVVAVVPGGQHVDPGAAILAASPYSEKSR